MIRLFHFLDHRTQPAAQGLPGLIGNFQHAGVAVFHGMDAGSHIRDTADGQQRTFVARHRGHREIRDLLVRQLFRFGKISGQVAKAGAEHHRDFQALGGMRFDILRTFLCFFVKMLHHFRSCFSCFSSSLSIAILRLPCKGFMLGCPT